MLKDTAKKLLKMGDLVRCTGVQKETIHFYIHKGLLPRPLKTGKNMAYYDESYIERIRLIKELQRKQFLPLNVIKELLAKPSDKLSKAEIDMIRKGEPDLAKLQRRRDAYEPMSISRLSERTGLPLDEIEAMERCGMISSTIGENGRRLYSDDDARIVDAFASMRKSGLTREAGFEVDEFRLQNDMISMMAVEEVKVFARKFAEKYSPEEAEELLPKIAENAVESVGAFIWYLRKKKIFEAVHAFVEDSEEFLEEDGAPERQQKNI